MAIRAKFKVTSIEPYPKEGEATQAQVHLQPVYSADPNSENYSWSKWTPSGELKMTITNPSAFQQFEAGKEYYLDITPADA